MHITHPLRHLLIALLSISVIASCNDSSSDKNLSQEQPKVPPIYEGVSHEGTLWIADTQDVLDKRRYKLRFNKEILPRSTPSVDAALNVQLARLSTNGSPLSKAGRRQC